MLPSLVAPFGSTSLSEKIKMNAFKKTLVAIAAAATLGATGLASTQAFANNYGYNSYGGYGGYGYNSFPSSYGYNSYSSYGYSSYGYGHRSYGYGYGRRYW
jgi:hypothetical protein